MEIFVYNLFDRPSFDFYYNLIVNVYKMASHSNGIN